MILFSPPRSFHRIGPVWTQVGAGRAGKPPEISAPPPAAGGNRRASNAPARRNNDQPAAGTQHKSAAATTAAEQQPKVQGIIFNAARPAGDCERQDGQCRRPRGRFSGGGNFKEASSYSCKGRLAEERWKLASKIHPFYACAF
jgi:hypothetical protein